MKLLGAPLGLLLNFHEMKRVQGVHRMILPGADGSGLGRTAGHGESDGPVS